MAFVFTPEDGSGVAGANAYADLPYVRDYHDGRGQLVEWDGTPVTIAVASVDAAADTLNVGVHTFRTGDGPIRLTNAGGALPAGLAGGVDYWLVVASPTTVKLATSYANAIAGTPVVDITGAGTGTHSVTGPDFAAQRAAIVRATDYVEQNYADQFLGVRKTTTQGLFWPADGVYIGELAVTGVPDLVKRAIAEYSLRARRTSLAPDGRAVTSESRSEGGVSRSVVYASAGTMQSFPVADRWLAPLLRPSYAERA